jgi:hypothetical protein
LAASGLDLAVATEQHRWYQHDLNDEEPTMTATIATRTPRRTVSDCSLLRFAMRLDATLCAATGLFVAALADPLSRLSGMSATSEWIAGAGLVGYGALLYSLASAPGIRRVGIGIVIANVVFAIVAGAVVAAGALPLTGVGVAMTAMLVATVIGCAYLQYLGVRRLA